MYCLPSLVRCVAYSMLCHLLIDLFSDGITINVPSEGDTLKQNYFHQHFLSEDHHRLLEDCKTKLIDKSDSSDSTRRELSWMYELTTFAPLGLNIYDIV